MQNEPAFSITLAGFPIELSQNSRGKFTVTYGKQVHKGMTYGQAAKELGVCIMHALACESLIDNEVG